jgi:hypothetical protein
LGYVKVDVREIVYARRGLLDPKLCRMLDYPQIFRSLKIYAVVFDIFHSPIFDRTQKDRKSAQAVARAALMLTLDI